jgi:putative heme iron utilization protein
MKSLSKLHQEAITKARTETDQNKAAALAMIEKPIEMIKAIMLKHELAVIEVMRELHESREAAVRAEREACAAICDNFQARDVGMQPAECAGAIRARSGGRSND